MVVEGLARIVGTLPTMTAMAEGGLALTAPLLERAKASALAGMHAYM
jgi:hypothetical protein